jgi:hypothetical protein
LKAEATSARSCSSPEGRPIDASFQTLRLILELGLP